METSKFKVIYAHILIKLDAESVVSRFHSILYNLEAVRAHDEVGHTELGSAGPENVFFADPIRYDEEVRGSTYLCHFY